MTLDAAAVAFGDLVFGERGEEAGGGPAFLVRPLGKGWPVLLDGGQPKVVEQQRQAGASMAWLMPPLRISSPSSAS